MVYPNSAQIILEMVARFTGECKASTEHVGEKQIPQLSHLKTKRAVFGGFNVAVEPHSTQYTDRIH